jgi:hypothetical protein
VTAAEALQQARAAGLCLEVDGDELVLSASAPPPQAVISLLVQCKAGVLALLRPDDCGWTAEDWLAFFDERDAIAEFERGLPRDQAEARAFACCVAEWLNRNVVSSPPGRCLACGGGDERHDRLLPFGSEPANQAWLHSRCWRAWYARRRAEALASLASMGITEKSST